MTHPNLFQSTPSPNPTLTINYDIALAEARRQLRDENYEQAAGLFRNLALAQPFRHHSWWGLGACHEALEDWSTAACIYDLGYRLSGSDATLGLFAARAYLKLQKIESAQAILSEINQQHLDEVHSQALSALEGMH